MGPTVLRVRQVSPAMLTSIIGITHSKTRRRSLPNAMSFEHFGAHDLRRTCAKLCRKNGGDLEQIKFLLGHSSIQTTERYLGSDQEIAIAVNDNLGL
jgi:integrase